MPQQQGSNAGEWRKKWSQIVAKAWSDPALAQRLRTDPASVVKENGLEVPPGVQLKVVEDTDAVMYLLVPLKPRTEELSDEELSNVAGGRSDFDGCEGSRCCERCERRCCSGGCGDR